MMYKVLKLTCVIGRQQFSTTNKTQGGMKMKRRKLKMRAENPHLPEKIVKTVKTLAIDNFDFYYPQFYGSRWPSMRLGLLSHPKHCAVVNNFGDPDHTIDMLKSLGCVNVTEVYNNLIQPIQHVLSKGTVYSDSDDIKDDKSYKEGTPSKQRTGGI